MKRIFFILALALMVLAAPLAQAKTIDFEDCSLQPECYCNNPSPSGGFTSRGAFFNNYYYADWNYWDGWSYSNRTDTTTPMDYTNQWSSIAGGGYGGSGTYGVAYDGSAAGIGGAPTVGLGAATALSGGYFTNTTYAYSSMLLGDGFADAFDYGDWFLLTITGYYNENETGSVEFYLADFRSQSSCDWYIIDDWTWVNLNSLGVIDSLAFTITGSDVGDYGLNTPAYFAMDNLTTVDQATVPIPGAVWLLGSGLVGLAGLRRKRAVS